MTKNGRLWAAMIRSAVTVDEVADAAGVDPKTVQRWLQGRVPHRRHRIAAARQLGVDEAALWPEATQPSDSQSNAAAELVRIYPARASIPRETWLRLIDDTHEQVDILVFAGTFIVQMQPKIARTIADKVQCGVEIRLCFGEPTGEAVAIRAREEAYTLDAKIRSALTYYRSVADMEGCSIRLHNATVYASLFRFDDEMIINPHAYGEPASANPCLHVRRIEGGTLFEHYADSFERVWAMSRQWHGEAL
jgi:transcriptional regulator with XRE-family HTH domain